MMRGPDAPAARAASTYSFSRSERNSPRTIRAIGIQPSTARIRRSCPPTSVAGGRSNSPKNVGSGFLATISSTASSGTTSTRSVNRISSESIQPP